MKKQDYQKRYVEEKIQVLNTAHQVSTLLGIIAEKLNLKFTKGFWQQLVNEYNSCQKQAEEARQMIQEFREDQELLEEFKEAYAEEE